MSDKVKNALEARKARKKKEEDSYKEKAKKSQEKVSSALKARESRIKSNLQSTYSDLEIGINKEIEAFKKLSDPSWGGGNEALKTSLESTRQNRINVNNLIRKVEAHRKYLGDEKADTILESLNSMKSGYDSYVNASQVRSQYKSEDEYDKKIKEAEKAQKEYETKTTLDIDAGKKEIEGLLNGDEMTFLKKRQAEIQEQIRKLGSHSTGKGATKSGELRKELIEVESKIKEIEKQASQKKAYINQAEYIQKGIKITEEAKNAKDFDAKSQYVSTKADGFLDKLTADSLGFNDSTYEYINNIGGYREKYNDEHRTYSSDNPFDDGESSFEEKGYDYITDEEIKIYNYYYSTEGKEKAEKFLDSIQETLSYRKATKDFSDLEGRTFAEILFGVEAGLDQFSSGMKNLFNTSDDYIPSTSTQVTSGMVREDLADNGFKILGSSIGQIGYDLTNTTANMLPSILTSTAIGVLNPTAGAVVGAGLMGASASGNAYAEMLNLGYDKGQARLYSGLVGASEATLQYLLGGIGKLGGGKLTTEAIVGIANNLDNAFARVAIKLGANALGEFTEEYLQEVLNPFFKNITLGTDEDVKLFSTEALYSGILGALSAGILEGGSTIASDVQTTKLGKKVQNIDGGVARLKKLGTTFSADSVAYQIADKVTEETGAYKIGLLLQEAGATLSEQNVSDIVIALTNKGMPESSAKKIAKTYQSFLNEEMSLSDEQVEVLEGLDPLADVLRKNIIGRNTEVYQRTREYSDLVKLATEMNTETDISSVPQTDAEISPQPTALYSNEYIDTVAKEFEAVGMPSEQARIMAQAKLYSPTEGKSSPTEQKAVESKFEVSADGKTINTKNDEIVSIKKIESISEDGEANLSLNDGMVVKASDLSFGSDAEAIFVENIGAIKVGKNPISTSSANALYMTAMKALEEKPNMTADEASYLIKGLEESYIYGTYNLGRSSLTSRNADGSARLFAGELTQSQRAYAYELGSQDSVSKAKADQKVIDDLKAKAEGKPSKKTFGKVIFEKGAEVVDESALTETQKTNLDGIKLLAEISSVEFHVFRSDKNNKFKYTMPNGTVTTANGWFVAGTNQIWIDLNAGNAGEGTMIRTAAHEISHYIKQWSPQKWNAMAELLMGEFAKNGVDTEAMLNRQIAKIKRRYNKSNMPSEAVLKDMAHEELVSDALSDMLTDGSIVNFIAEVKAKDMSLAKKIINAIKSLLKKWGLIIDDYKGRDLDTAEAQALSQLEDTFKKLQELYQEAFMDANEAVSLINDIVNIDADSESVSPMLSERTWTESEYVIEREKTAKAISSALGVDINTAYKYIDDINSVARLIADDRVRLDYDPNIDEDATVLKKNSEYKYSVDMSTLCAKRLLTTGTFDAIQRKLPNTVFSSEDIVALREMMLKRGYEVACGICYVESTRREMGRITQDFINSYIESQKTGKPITRINSSGQAVDLKKTKDEMLTTADKSADKFYADKSYTPTLADLNTTDIDLVKKEHPLVYEAYLNFMNARGQAKPKLLETRAEYKGEILKHFKSKTAVKARNDAGGLRLQSFSDFEVPHLIDMMQIVMDMSRVGLKSQAYTKVPAFAEVFGNTGVKINLSLIAKGSGLDANGNLVFDDIEGINHEEAFKLRDKFSKNVGTILVGKTDAHIIAAMADPRIDYIIPFHKSSWKESLYEALGLTGYADYTDFQNEKSIDKDRKIKNIDPSEYWDFTKSGDENAQIYLEKCRKDGRIPKFPQFQGYPGYWKLLIDFKMYDNEGVGSPQEVVNPTFEMDAAETILNEYKGGHRSFPVAKDVVEDFVNDYVSNVKFSDRDKSYMDAVESGDMETAQRLVDEAAKEAGYDSPLLYHGTKMFGFTKIKTSGVEEGIDWSPFFTANEADIAASYVPYGKVRDISSSMDDDAIEEARESAIEERKENISDLVYEFRRLIDRYFSPWVFGQTDNSYIEELVEGANPEPGYGDGVYDVLSDIVYDTFYDYQEDNFAEYEDADEWAENSPEGKEMFAKILEIEGEKSALHRLEQGEELGGIYKMRANLDNMYVVDGKGAAWNELRPEGLPKLERNGYKNVPYKTRDVAKWARENGFYGVIFKNIRDNGAYGRTPAGDVYVFFNPQEQVKSADPVTYDDDGNVIPLSQRFNLENEDIRYSGRDYSYDTLTSKPDMPITSVNDKVTYKPTSTIRKNIVEKAIKNASSFGKLNENGNVVIHVDDIDTDVILSKNSLIHGLDRRLKTSAPVILNVGSILKNSIRINELTPKKQSAIGSYVLIGYAESTDYAYPVRMVVNQYTNEVDTIDVLYAVNTKKETVGKMPGSHGKTALPTVSNIKIADLLEFVNRHFADVLPESVLRHYGHTERPKGELGESALFSERDASNRSILANALESVAQNDIEKNKLAEYKEKISLIESEEKRLSEIQKKLFTKGAVEPTERKDLQFEAKQIANRINTYDRQLLNLESTTALKNVLNREKALAMKRQKQKDNEALKQYKEKVAKTTKELLAKNQESRKKAIEGREKTAMRHKIKSVVNDLNNLLLKPTKERHIPEEMRIAVAEALDLVNMDTVAADERVAKYNELIAKAKDPDVIASLTETRDHILNQGTKLADKLSKLKEAYAMVRDSADDSLNSMYDDVIYSRIESVQKIIGKTPIRTMTLAQLESVYDLYKMVLTTVRDSNKAFAENITMSRLALGSNTFAEIKEGNKIRDTIKHPSLERFLWQNLKPMQAMKTIGSGTLQKLWNNVLYGQEVFAVDYDEAVKFAQEMKDKYGYKKWNLNKLYSFKSKSGKTMKINLEQMMSIYAYSKRPQADEHILYGGIVLNEGIVKVKNKLGKTVEVKVNDSTAHRLDNNQIADIISTIEQVAPGAKEFVDEMQKYLSETMGEKGNEVAMKMYGIKLFKEEHYFPLKSSKDFMEAANAKLKGDVKIKNKGMTKATVEHARNPIVLENFLDVWGNHINEMALYHGLVLPLEDFSRTLNYSFKADDKLNADAESVRTALHDAFGESADNYLNELLKAINGGVLHDSSAQFADKMISKFKKAKVMASLSVVVQQPTAIIRAMSIIDPKYFVSQNFKHKATWEELKKYCPTAIIKETGSFDTNMGRTIVDMIKDERGFTDKVGDVLGKAPAYMDEVGWNMIWRALKKKVAIEQKLSGEALLQECGRQMTLIINETQVYDSVMSRNELMRSKNALTKMATSFMAEPSTVANMIYGAGLDFKRGKKGMATKTVAAVITSVVVNGLVSAMVYALRDDDEEKTLLEKYLSSATSEVVDSLNPLTYIPFIKDAYSLFQGYKVERTDMALIKDVVDAVNTFYNVLNPEAYEEDMSKDEIAKHIYENAKPLLTSICDMFGLPVGNIMRDAEAIIVNDNVPMSQTSQKGTGYALKEGLLGTLPKIVSKVIGTDSKQGKLYDAIVSGDTVYVDRLKSGYKDDKAYETAVRKALRENDPRIKEAAEARINGDVAEYTRIVKQIKAEGFFSQDTIVASVNAEINAINKGESSSTDSATEDKASSIYKMDDYYASIIGGDQATAYVVKEDIINIDVENGKDRDEAESSFNSRFANYLREQYEEGYISEDEAKDMLVDYGDKSEEDANSKVQYWAFKQEYPDYDDLSEEAVDKYYNDVEPHGISVDVYYDYSKQKAKCKGTDNNGDGKTDSGSKKAEILRVINSLPLTYSQKDVLYYLNGWSSKTINEAPWH